MKALLVLLISVFAFLGGCEVAPTNPQNANEDTGSASDGDTDTDSDSDTDIDTDTDTNVYNEDGALVIDCSDCPSVGETADEMLCAIDLCDSQYVISNEFSSPMPGINPIIETAYTAIERFGDMTNELDPQLNGSYALMGSGDLVFELSSSLLSDDEGILDPFNDEDTMYDIVEWKIALKAPKDAQSISFYYVFFSEEFDEFIGHPFNDKFYAIIEAQSTNYGDPTIINFAECRDPELHYDFDGADCDLPNDTDSSDDLCCYIAINSSASECCTHEGCPYDSPNDNLDISGTNLECTEGGSSTKWLQTQWPIKAYEEFTLTFHIHDTADRLWDSAVLIDSFEFQNFEAYGTAPPVIE